MDNHLVELPPTVMKIQQEERNTLSQLQLHANEKKKMQPSYLDLHTPGRYNGEMKLQSPEDGARIGAVAASTISSLVIAQSKIKKKTKRL